MDQTGQTIAAETNVQAVGTDVHPLHQQRHDPSLLGREQLVPERIELLQRLAAMRRLRRS